MTYFAGFDTDHYPGDEAMAWLQANTPLSWCACYLAPAPSHSDISWQGRRAGLVAHGWGVLPVFLGQQTTGPGSHVVTAAQGSIDGTLAVSLAQAEGFPAGTTVILDWEDGSLKSPEATDYIGAWATALLAGKYFPGIYCSHNLAAALDAVVSSAITAFKSSDSALSPPPPTLWAWRVTEAGVHPFDGDIRQLQPQAPAGCGFAAADLWQFEQNATLSLPGTPCDGLCVDLSWSLQPCR